MTSAMTSKESSREAELAKIKAGIKHHVPMGRSAVKAHLSGLNMGKKAELYSFAFSQSGNFENAWESFANDFVKMFPVVLSSPDVSAPAEAPVSPPSSPPASPPSTPTETPSSPPTSPPSTPTASSPSKPSSPKSPSKPSTPSSKGNSVSKVAYVGMGVIIGFVLCLAIIGMLIAGLLSVFFGAYSTYVALIAVAGFVLIMFLKSEFLKEFMSLKGILFFVLFFVHCLLYRQGYVSGSGWISISIFYAIGIIIVAVIYAILTNADKDHIIKIVIVSFAALIMYMLPAIVLKLGESMTLDTAISDGVVWFVTLIPIWPLYLLNQISNESPGGAVSGVLKIWYIVIMIVPLIGMAYGLVYASQSFAPGTGVKVDAGQSMSNFWTLIKEKATLTYGQITGTIDRAKNPGAYYTGQVDASQKKELGVKITDLRMQDKVVSADSPAILYGNIRADAFLGESVKIAPACIIEGKDMPATSSVEPTTMDVVYGTSQSFQCTFPPIGKQGAYNVKAQAEFPFQTWAYITYTFVDEERARNIAKQGLDIKKELTISEEPAAIYTKGPMKMGMGGSKQPILIRPEKDPIVQPGTKIGITLDNGWDVAGRLQQVNKMELRVPKPFTLTNCDRNLSKTPEQDPNEPEYQVYTFENPYFNIGTTWTSVTCTLSIKSENREDAIALVSSADKTVRSFVASATYTYTVEQKSSFQVQ